MPSWAENPCAERRARDIRKQVFGLLIFVGNAPFLLGTAAAPVAAGQPALFHYLARYGSVDLSTDLQQAAAAAQGRMLRFFYFFQKRDQRLEIDRSMRARWVVKCTHVRWRGDAWR